MTLQPIVNGQVVSENQNSIPVFAVTQAGLNLIRQLQDRSIDFSAGQMEGWAEAYTDASGRKDSVDTDDQVTTAEFDTDKYKVPAISGPYVIIEATSISSSGDFNINNCQINRIGSGKWALHCTTGTDAVKRAQIYKTLFYGTNGSDPRSTSTYITGITALKTSVSRDVGKKAQYAEQKIETNGVANIEVELDGTFAATSGNTDVSSWSVVIKTNEAGSGVDRAQWELPEGTTLNSRNSVGTTDETGTDREADEYDNPTDCQFSLRANSGSGTDVQTHVKAFILTAQTISWSQNIIAQTGSSSITADVQTDFFVDESVPLFTLSSSLSSEIDGYEISHNLPSGTFGSTISSAIGVPFIVPGEWEDGADIQYKLTGTGGAEDTGWLDASNSPKVSTFTAFTAEPDTLIVKLIPKSSSPTAGYPSIKGFYVRSE